MKRPAASMSWPLVLLVLSVIGALVYSNIFQASFNFDDRTVIVDDPTIRTVDLGALWNAFNTRFLVGLSLAVNYAIGKLDVSGYHLFNVLVHIFAAFLVYCLTDLTFQTSGVVRSSRAPHGRRAALFASLVFLTHPLQTQAVTFTWQRSASMATLFYLAAMAFYVHSRLKDSALAYGGSLLMTVAAMLTKEISFTLPMAILLYEWFFFEGSPRKVFSQVWPLLLCLFIIPVLLLRQSQITMDFMRPNSGDMMRWVSEEAMPRSVYLLTQLNVLRTYIRLLFFPVRQNLDYDYALAHSFGEPGVLLSSLLLLGLLAAGIWLYRRHRLMSFCIFWFFLLLSIESWVVQNDVIFEHRLYLPMAAFSIFVSAALWKVLKSERRYMVCFCAIVLVLSSMAYRRNAVWHDAVTLWTDVIQKSPGKARGYANLASFYTEQGKFDQAVRYNRLAIERAPLPAHDYFFCPAFRLAFFGDFFAAFLAFLAAFFAGLAFFAAFFAGFAFFAAALGAPPPEDFRGVAGT